MKIVIVDYGMGNIHSLNGALEYLSLSKIILSNKIKDLESADKLILPGVGNFSAAMKELNSLKLDQHLKNLILIDKKPILGICLGMQLLCKTSMEGGFTNGLNLVDASVTEFNKDQVKVPHVGYNQIITNKHSKLYSNLSESPDFYFTHSYKVHSDENICQSFCSYQDDFIASFELDNIAGVQFHPELSQKNGLQLLKNFIDLF
jgi:imidazole glycerol-phosphate synthase subunit HisH